MKILMALNGLDIGGAETHVVELSKEIQRRGHEVVMVSSGGVYQKEVEDFGIKHYKVVLTSRNVSQIIKSKAELEKIILNEKPDIVHAHARIPGFILDGIHKKLKSFVFVTTAHWTFDTPFLVKKLTRWGEKTLAVSDDLKKYLLKYYPEVKEENIFISINGIDDRKFSKDISGERVAKEFSLSEKSKKIVYVSRLNPAVCAPAYGIIEKIGEIDKSVPGVEVIIVGGGDCYDDMCQKAEDANKALGRRAIIMAGPRTDINEIHANADVCVGVSRAILEPMVMEKKCVVAGQEGYIGILTPDKLDTAIKCNFTCRGCDELNNDIMVGDIISLLNMDEEKAKEITDYGKSVVLEYYSVKKMADDNLDMYNKAICDCQREAAILGYYGYGNSGDDALLHAIIGDIKKFDNCFTPIVLSNNPKSTSQIYGVESVNRFSIKDVKYAIKKAKIFILGGGSLVQDITSTKSLLYYLWCIRLAKRLKKPVMLYANGIGPITKKSNIERCKKVLNMVDVITLRDGESEEFLKKIGVNKPKIYVTADPAFSLEPCSDEKSRKLIQDLNIDGKYVCMSVRNWTESDRELLDEFAKMADYICEKYNMTVVFVPMHPAKDKKVSEKIIASMKYRGVFAENLSDASLLLGLIKNAEAVVSVRLHTLIFGAGVGVPSIGVNYDPKVSGFLKFTGQPYILNPTDLKTGNYKSVVDEFMENRDNLAKKLKEALPSIKEKSLKNAQIAAQLYMDKEEI